MGGLQLSTRRVSECLSWTLMKVTLGSRWKLTGEIASSWEQSVLSRCCLFLAGNEEAGPLSAGGELESRDRQDPAVEFSANHRSTFWPVGQGPYDESAGNDESLCECGADSLPTDSAILEAYRTARTRYRETVIIMVHNEVPGPLQHASDVFLTGTGSWQNFRQ